MVGVLRLPLRCQEDAASGGAQPSALVSQLLLLPGLPLVAPQVAKLLLTLVLQQRVEDFALELPVPVLLVLLLPPMQTPRLRVGRGSLQPRLILLLPVNLRQRHHPAPTLPRPGRSPTPLELPEAVCSSPLPAAPPARFPHHLPSARQAGDTAGSPSTARVSAAVGGEPPPPPPPAQPQTPHHRPQQRRAWPAQRA